MILYPNCKINLGLNIVAKRTDGFHDIETVFYPLPLYDILEALPSEHTSLAVTGVELDSPQEDNLVMKAYRLIQADRNCIPLQFHLHKRIPAGAGLGGGSADAAFAIKLVNHVCNLNLSIQEQMQFARKLGSDCAFFIKNIPVMATGKGDFFSDMSVSLSGYYILLIKPSIHVSTADAYASVKPNPAAVSPKDIVMLPVMQWKNHLHNQFEESVFLKYPILNDIKKWMYDEGAVYASMSGSGSSIYGIFNSQKDTLPAFINDFFSFKSQL